jgi:glycosyltransferase involved in cell wall biosynthesis
VTQPQAQRSVRVLKIAPTSFFADYGCHVRILEETLAIQRLGASVALCAYPGGRNLHGVDVRRVWGTPWSNSVRVGSSYHRLYLDALLGAWALNAVVDFRPDVIHAHLHEGAFVAAPIARSLGIPLVFDFQGSLTSEMLDHNFIRRGSPFFRPLRWLEGKINGQADVILTSSHNAADILEQQFGVAAERIVAIPDAVNPAAFRPRWSYSDEELRLERRRLGIPNGSKVVVYLGLLAEYQGSGHLLRAAKRICDTREDVHFLLMGFPGQRTYQELARSLGIAHRVTFTGGIPYEEAPRYLALGDVAVSPKLSETEGNGKLLNYMAVGLPTATFSTPVSREILGPLGRYAALGDEASLADELARLLDEDGNRLGRALRARAVELFSWEDQGQRIMDVYSSLLRR